MCPRENARTLVGLLARGGSKRSRERSPRVGGARVPRYALAGSKLYRRSNTRTVYPARSADAAAGNKRPKGAGQPSRFEKAWEGPLVNKLIKRVETGQGRTSARL